MILLASCFVLRRDDVCTTGAKSVLICVLLLCFANTNNKRVVLSDLLCFVLPASVEQIRAYFWFIIEIMCSINFGYGDILVAACFTYRQCHWKMFCRCLTLK